MSRVLIMSATQLRLLASCAMIGFEGACDNHEEADGENSNADLEAVELFINHIVELAAAGDVQVTLDKHEDEVSLKDFIAEARMHAADMPPVIQRDYLNTALDKLDKRSP